MKKKGFTLIELTIVLVILGVLAAIAVPTYVNLRSTALDNALKSSLGSIRSAVNLKHAENLLAGSDTYPSLTAALFDENLLPVDPVTSTDNVATSSDDPISVSGTNGGWIYNSTTGEVRINNTTAANDGTTYDSW
jgi:prepilin-type N-terminal cleavage/methylation domain-containing protein